MGVILAPVMAIARGIPIWVWALVACLAWGGYQHHRAGAQATKRAAAEKAAAVQAVAAAEQAKARAQEQAWTTATLEAADAYRSNLALAQRRAAAVRTERDRLFDAVAASPGTCAAAPGAAAASGTDATAALRVVVRECATALSQVAEAADAGDARLSGLQAYIRATQIGAIAPSPAAGSGTN